MCEEKSGCMRSVQSQGRIKIDEKEKESEEKKKENVCGRGKIYDDEFREKKFRVIADDLG